MSLDISEWLRGLGLAQYATTFRDNDIDDAVLRRLTAEDLRDLGVTSVGHRRLRRSHACGRCLGTTGRNYDDSRAEGRCRTPTADGDVLRFGRLDRTRRSARS